jgi:hypothetical protein
MALFGPPSQGCANCPFAAKALKTGAGEVFRRGWNRAFFSDILKTVTHPRGQLLPAGIAPEDRRNVITPQFAAPRKSPWKETLLHAR